MTVQELTAVFGKNIKNFRTFYDLSQEQLAEKMDLSINTICEIENGKKFVRAETLVGFAALFNTEVYELFKPETILPDNAAGVLVKYCEDVKKATEKIKKGYLGKLKR
jgi:transcriptional regulator with XRE-family HTH domain